MRRVPAAIPSSIRRGCALENFDVIGGWRGEYRATEGMKVPEFAKLFPAFLGPEGKFGTDANYRFRAGQKVDPSSELADGRKFADVREYQALILKQPRVVSRNLANQLVLYATGATDRICGPRRPSKRS